jgi:hypothetical protein
MGNVRGLTKAERRRVDEIEDILRIASYDPRPPNVSSSAP